MHGIQVAFAHNDENSSIHAGPTATSKEGVSFPTTKQSSALKSGRKAFGNITNTQSQEVATHGTIKRRAFGADLTNSTPGPRTAKKPDNAQLKPGLQPTQFAETSAAVHSWWETEPPEQSAGKTWEQLQADREREEDAEIETTVRQLLQGIRSISTRVLQVHAPDDSDDDEVLRIRPTIRSPPEWKQRREDAEESDEPTYGTLMPSLYQSIPLEDLLPDIAEPEEEELVLSPTAQGNSPIPSTASTCQPDFTHKAQSGQLETTCVQQQHQQTAVLQSTSGADQGHISPERQHRTCPRDDLLKSPDPLPW